MYGYNLRRNADISGTVENSPKDGTTRVSWKELVVVRRMRVRNVLRLFQRALKTAGVMRRTRTRTRTKMKIMAPTFLSSTDPK